MSWDMPNLQNLMQMFGQLFGAMPAGPKADYSVAGDSGKLTR